MGPFCGVATSQTTSPVINDQIQLGDVFSEQTLDVVEVTDDTTAVTTATGNSVLISDEGGSAAVTSSQLLAGTVTAATTLNVSVSPGVYTTLSTAATGNTGDASVSDGGALSGTFAQTTTSASVSGNSQIEGPNAQAGDVSASVQAMVNSQGFALSDATADVTVTQANSADAVADGGATLRYATGSVVVSAATVGNNVSAVGVGNSSQALDITQANTATLTQASQFTAYGNSYLSTTNATASGNNVTVTNEGTLLDVTNSQTNDAYVYGQAESSSYLFGAGSATAYGVGNSVLAGNFGPEVSLDNTQVNQGGGIETVASFTGDSGYDAFASSTAMGNAATAYACAYCGGTMTIGNSQTNGVDVGARSSMSVTGQARSATAIATAVGNNASFYVTRPE